ncbi:MAG: serine--tRNA ligase [Candidatus Harrisonbacteria bacterium]|nr:serine--tRNA ligase [Candidatus Harrisonbacteria bacterium]
MLDINLIRKYPESVRRGIAAKNADPALVDKFLEVDRKWRALTQKFDEMRAEQKKLGEAKRVEEAKKLKEEIKKIENNLNELEKIRTEILYQIPNLPFKDVPIGKDENENQVIRTWGEIPKFNFKPKDHMELGEALDIIDTKTASKVVGSRFNYLKGQLAIMEFAIVQYVFSLLTDKNFIKKVAEKISPDFPDKPFIPVIPPVMINPETFTRMARLDPGQQDERFYLPKEGLYLVGSAEHTLGPLHMDEIIPENKLPIRYVGFSSAFRREAGSYGKDVYGILRVHQFDKIELESFTLPELSRSEQDFIVSIQEYLMQSLKLPYRVVSVCTGDMGGPDARQIDIETWMPSQNKYRETHTSDLMTDYQSRRLKTRVKRNNSNTELVHMNDATAFAIGRILIAIIENYQTEKGTVLVPKVLQNYLGIKEIKIGNG